MNHSGKAAKVQVTILVQGSDFHAEDEDEDELSAAFRNQRASWRGQAYADCNQ